MESQQESRERSGVLGGVASVLNTGGSALVYVYDVTTGAFGRLVSVAKKTPKVPVKAYGMITGTVGKGKPGKVKDIEGKIQ